MFNTIPVLIAIMLSILIISKGGGKYILPCIAIICGSLSCSILIPAFRSTLGILSSNEKIIAALSGTIAFGAALLCFWRMIPDWLSISIPSTAPNKQKLDYKDIIVIVVTAFITISFIAKASPLYAFNDWCDANYFLTVGRGIINGVVPYRDLYEQKGPLLYFVHAIAVLIDYSGFKGVYIIELITCTLYLFFSAKLLLLFADKRIVLFTPILAGVVYSSYTFNKGDSCEELCLWCLVYGLYIGFRIMMNDESLRKYHFIILGFIGGIVLWMKYLMLGFFIGWFIFIATYMIKTGQIKRIIYIIYLLFLGAMACTLLVCIYFIANHSLTDLFQVYFYNNMFGYEIGYTNGIINMLRNVVVQLFNRGLKNIFVSAFIIIGFAALIKMNKKYFLFCLSCFVCTVFFLYFKGSFIYYTFCLGTFAPLGMILPFWLISGKRSEQFFSRASFLGIVLTFALFISLSPNLRYINETKNDMIQYKFRNTILQKENPTIINYGFQDYGFYTVCGLVPQCRFFCTYNIFEDLVEKEQKQYILSNKPDFVITDKEIYLNNYELAETGEYYDNVLRITRHYYLYEVVSNNSQRLHA